MRAVAPGKINWTLEVLERRDDGYHEVRTVLQTISLCDELTLEEADDITLKVEGEHALSDDDLILAAARLLQEAAAPGRGAAIHVKKSVPVAAGLGGGSSDAAAALRALDRLWGCDLPPERLAVLAAALGSDVSFFLAGGTALATGRGEIVTPLPDIKPVWMVLLVPPLFIPDKTPAMYAALQPGDFTDGSRTADLVEAIRSGTAPDPSTVYNVFDRAAEKVFPELEDYRRILADADLHTVHLAGAGPGLFALANSSDHALDAAARLEGGSAATVVTVVTLTAGEATAIEP